MLCTSSSRVALACGALAITLSAPSISLGQDARISPVDLELSQLTAPARIVAGKPFVVVDTVNNVGDSRAPLTVVGFCLARTTECGANDVRFAARRVPALPPGGSNSNESRITVPPSVPAGQYYLVVVANANNDVQERRRDNNIRTVPVTVETSTRTQ